MGNQFSQVVNLNRPDGVAFSGLVKVEGLELEVVIGTSMAIPWLLEFSFRPTSMPPRWESFSLTLSVETLPNLPSVWWVEPKVVSWVAGENWVTVPLALCFGATRQDLDMLVEQLKTLLQVSISQA